MVSVFSSIVVSYGFRDAVLRKVHYIMRYCVFQDGPAYSGFYQKHTPQVNIIITTVILQPLLTTVILQPLLLKN